MYQFLRRSCLAATLLALLLVPVWHLGNNEAEGSGLVGGGPWVTVADRAGLSATSPRLLGALWSVEVFGVEFLDPLAAASLMATRSPGVSMLLAILPTLLLVGFLGRFFCGWLCPYVPVLAASNATRTLAARFGIRLPDIELGRGTSFIVLFCVLLLTAFSGTIIAPLLYPPAIIGRQLFRAVYFGGLGFGVLAIALVFVFDTLAVRSGFCRYICPGGALFRLVGVASPLRVRRDPEACDSCGDCDEICRLGQSPMTDRLDAGCERCGLCVASCPNDALRIGVGRPSGTAHRTETRT